MAQNRYRNPCFLDEVRINEGNDRCKAVFGGLCEKDKRRAAILLNDPRLTFPCLFILEPQIESNGFGGLLSPRNATAQKIIHSMRMPDGFSEAEDLPENNDATHSALRWILETGQNDDGLSDEYEEVLEVAASILINTYQDMRALPVTVDLIFKRNREAHNIHHLVWAAFKSRSPYALKLIAQHIRSSDERDVRLACNLLGIEAPDVGGAAQDNQKRYQMYLQWLKENDPYMYFTGESFQYASRPAFYRLDLERKYVHRGTPHYDRQPIEPADGQERSALAVFNTLGPEQKRLLSEYSHEIHEKNLSEWKTWVQRPVDEQIKTAKLNREKRNDYGIGQFV